MDNTQDIGIRFTNRVTGQAKLEKYEETLKSIQTLLNNMPKTESLAIGGSNINKKLDTANKLLVNLNKNMSSFKRSTTSSLGEFKKYAKTLSKGFKDIKTTQENSEENALTKIFDIGKIPALIKTLTTIKEKMAQLVDKSALYIENMNLLDVAYNNNTKSAKKLISRMTEMYGLDESWGYRTVGLFKQLSNAMGLADETGTKLANTLTMLAIDLSSLYNTDTTEAVTKLTSALSGLIKIWLEQNLLKCWNILKKRTISREELTFI